jgi:hypothetical protein
MQVVCFASLVERNARRGNENATRLVASLKALLTFTSKLCHTEAPTLTANAAT